MNKSSLFIAAGAAVILCGCSTTPVAGNKPVIPAPVEDPQPIETPATITADDAKLAPATRQSQVPAFEPLTGVTSSGGVVSAPRGRKSVKSAKAGKVVAAGGTYIVKSGDTPERIARRHGVRLSALMAANNLTPQSARRLQIGQKLTIPGRNAKVAVSGTTKAAKKSSSAVVPVATADADGKYVVKPGDSPERIARKLRVRLNDLLKANNLDQQSARRLQIGQKLIIPGKDVAPEVKPPVTKDQEVIVKPDNNDSEVIIPPVTQPDNSTSVSTPDNTVIEQPAVTGTVDAVDAESEIEMRTIEENTTAAELAAKYNVSAEVISEKNSGKTEFVKGDLIFIPKK